MTLMRRCQPPRTVKHQSKRRTMRRKRAQRLAQAAGIFDRAIARIAVTVRIRANVNNRFGKIRWRRRKRWIVLVGPIRHRNKARIEEEISVWIVLNELLRI